jgi:transposase
MLIYGIDVSKSYLDVHTRKNEKGFTKRVANKTKTIIKFLDTVPSEGILCAEFTGVYADLLVKIAHCNDIKIALVSPFTLSKSMGNQKGKSDKTDAQRIWEYAIRFTDKLEFVVPKSQTIEELTELMNLRGLLIKQRKMHLTSQKSNGYKTSLSISGHNVAKLSIAFLSEQIKEVELQLLAALEQNPKCLDNFNLITSIKGIGKITAIELLVKSGNFTKINTARQAAAYAGVCPYLNESGSIKRKPKVHPRSDKKLKSLLYLAAVSACINNKDFKQYKQRKMDEGKHYFLVMNNVANKLLRLIYAVIKSGKPYDPMYLTLDPRKNINKNLVFLE